MSYSYLERSYVIEAHWTERRAVIIRALLPPSGDNINLGKPDRRPRSTFYQLMVMNSEEAQCVAQTVQHNAASPFTGPSELLAAGGFVLKRCTLMLLSN